MGKRIENVAIGVLAVAIGFCGSSVAVTGGVTPGQRVNVDRAAPRPDLTSGPTPAAADVAKVPRSTTRHQVQPRVAPPRVIRVVTVAAKKPKPKVTTISGYHYCGKTAKKAQPCIDKGWLVLYYPTKVPTLAGHDYKGWYWLDDLPTGRKVVIKAGGLKGTYKVYAHAQVLKKGGSFPAAGKNAAVALQTCEGKYIAFSFLKRA